MGNQRKRLIEQLADTVQFYSKRKTVGLMKTEHSIFLPSEYLINKTNETEEFIKLARRINENASWGCPVIAEKREGKFKGVEFVFQFSKDTKFDKIIQEIRSVV